LKQNIMKKILILAKLAKERATCACYRREEWVYRTTVYSTRGTTWSGSPLWKEATATITALVYSGLHTRLNWGYVQVYWLVYCTRVYASTPGGKQNGSPQWYNSTIAPCLYHQNVREHIVIWLKNATTSRWLLTEKHPFFFFFSVNSCMSITKWFLNE
jgi:hypothetical protein